MLIQNEIVWLIAQRHIEQDPSNPQEKPAEETHSFDDLNVPKVNEKEGKENSKSHQTIKGESEILISHEGSASLSKPAEDSSNIHRTMVMEGTIFCWMYLFPELAIKIIELIPWLDVLHLINCFCVLFFTIVLMSQLLPVNKSSLFSYK